MDMIKEGTHLARHEADALAARAGEYLTFRLGGEEYGIDILRVQEIRSYEQPTRIANAPGYIKGVVNLRGVIVPIVDLRVRLGCAQAEYNHFTVVIVLNVKGRVVGAVVDSVSDVLELPAEAIRPAPPMATQRRRQRLSHRHRQRRRTHADPDGHRGADEQPRHGPADRHALIHEEGPVCHEQQDVDRGPHARQCGRYHRIDRDRGDADAHGHARRRWCHRASRAGRAGRRARRRAGAALDRRTAGRGQRAGTAGGAWRPERAAGQRTWR